MTTPYRIPAIGDFVTAEVIKISRTRGAECRIVAITNNGACNMLTDEYRGTVRNVDVAGPGLQLEFAEISECFRPGDIIKAKVISLGDSKAYFLSTVPDDCGILRAKLSSTIGSGIPASYKLVCDSTMMIAEKRKVAKPVSLSE